MKTLVAVQTVIIIALAFLCLSLYRGSRRGAEGPPASNGSTTGLTSPAVTIAPASDTRGPGSKSDQGAKVATTAQEEDASSITTIRISDVISENPEYASIYQNETRWRIIGEYGEFIAGLGLSHKDLSRLKDLLVMERQIETDTTGAVRDAGIKQGSSLHRAATTQTTQDIRSEIAALIGEAGYDELKQTSTIRRYEEQLGVHMAPALLDAGIPLDAETRREIAKVFASTRGLNSTKANTPDPATGLSEADRILLDKMSPLLSPDQLAVVRQVRIQNNARQRILSKYIAPGATWTLVP